jgi:hypothetical protein
LRTLEWVLQQQAMRATADADGAASAGFNWLRSLLPSQWIPVLKAYRDWILFGAGVALSMAWLMSLYARRPAPRPLARPAPKVPSVSSHAPTRIRRRRRRARSSALT